MVASELGETVVALGAVRRAIIYLQEHALIDVDLPAQVRPRTAAESLTT